MSKPYRTCHNCGNHLDPGEHCDCQEREQGDTVQNTAQSAGMEATQDRREPVLAPGA